MPREKDEKRMRQDVQGETPREVSSEIELIEGLQNKVEEYIEKKVDLLEMVEEIHETKRSITDRIQQGKKSWIKESLLFSGIALVLSIGVSGVLALFLKSTGVIQILLNWLEKAGADDKLQQTVVNPLLVAYSMLYGGENQVYLIFNKMDEYRFTIMPPLFFVGITILILWVSEELRYKITKNKRDMYSNIAIGIINGLVVMATCFLLTRQLVIKGQGLTNIIKDSKLYMLYDEYVTYVAKPSLKVISTVNFLRIWGMSATLTFFTLTFFGRDKLVFRTYQQVGNTLVYIGKKIGIAIGILAFIITCKIVFIGAYMPMSFSQIHIFGETFCLLAGMLLCGLLTGHIPFMSYAMDANSLLELKMEIFTMEASFKKNVSFLDNPIGSYFLILVVLILGMIFLSSFRHWKDRKVGFSQGVGESLVVASILSISGGLFSRLGAFSFSLDCDTTNRSVNFNNLIAGVGATNFWEVVTKVFIITLLFFLLGLGISQMWPKQSLTLGRITEGRWNDWVWIGLMISVGIIIVLTVESQVIAEISKMYEEAIQRSQLNILLRLEEVFK